MKMKLLCSSLLIAAAGLMFAAPAEAKIDEVRFGVVGNIRSDQGEIVEGKEDGANVELEIVSSSPDFLNLIGSPRPYIMGSLNTGDGVSFGGVGVVWRWEFADGWAFEPGFGYIVHNGEIDNPFPPLSPEGIAFEADHQLLGSRDLFRSSFALERELGERAALQLYWQHMSHGQILDSGRNQGLDYVGLRFLYRFDADPAD
ncbi:MAG: acyloxyacyl hydrolase [Phycisphaerales bacterium]|nr:acyloxyacyl hydrolase [Hyphomonadaceae bacterium]